jgi:hypothetical protein
MQFSLLTMLLIGLGAMFFGYAFGLFEGRDQGYKKGKQEGEQRAQAERPPAFVPPVPPKLPPDDSLLKLSQDEQGQLRLDLDNQRVDTRSLAPAQRKRLIDLVVVMRPWMEGSSTPPAAPPPAPAPVAPRVPITAAAVPLAPISASAQKKEARAPVTMVEQIDAILQLKLAGTPLALRGIRLVESPEGGVTVEDGLQKYAGVGDVPDPAVQALIRAAIAEWEDKYTPGAR